jgi:hypothetical protein
MKKIVESKKKEAVECSMTYGTPENCVAVIRGFVALDIRFDVEVFAVFFFPIRPRASPIGLFLGLYIVLVFRLTNCFY